MTGGWSRCWAALVVLALAVLPPSAASADNAIEPPIPYLSPAQFQSVPVSHGGFEVTYACPAYASGDSRDYAVRLSNGDARGNDGRLIANGPYWVTEAPALPGAAVGTCRSQLLLPTNMPTPPPLFLGPVTWQVYRHCSGCLGGVEVAPLAWTLLIPNVEGADLAVPQSLYAGYLSRFTFGAAVDLSGTEIAVQGIGRWVRGGWTDLARAPYEPGGENALFVKLPAGTHKLRVNIYYGSFGFSQGLPPQEVEVLSSRGPRATGEVDDGSYRAVGGPLASFDVVGMGRALRDLAVRVPLSCGDPAAQLAEVRLPNARIAPDGTVTARALSRGSEAVYVTLVGKLRHRRFHGTVTSASASCSGSREFEARRG